MRRASFFARVPAARNPTGDMLAAQGMNISEQEYLAAMDDIVGARTNKLDEGTKNE